MTVLPTIHPDVEATSVDIYFATAVPVHGFTEKSLTNRYLAKPRDSQVASNNPDVEPRWSTCEPVCTLAVQSRCGQPYVTEKRLDSITIRRWP